MRTGSVQNLLNSLHVGALAINDMVCAVPEGSNEASLFRPLLISG